MSLGHPVRYSWKGYRNAGSSEDESICHSEDESMCQVFACIILER